MHLVTASAAPATSLPTLPDGYKLIGKTPHIDNGLTWQAYENRSTFQYGFAVSTGFISAAEHPTAAPAERAARRWCAAFVTDPVFEPAPPLEVVGAEAFDAAVCGDPITLAEVACGDQISPVPIAGWRIEVSEGRAGTYKAEVFRETTGDVGALDQDFTGYETARLARNEAAIWAMQHPCDEVFGAPEVRDISVEVELVRTSYEPATPDAEAAGWRIFATATGDKWALDIIDAATGDPASLGRFWHDTRDDAVEAGTTWAIANPTDAAVAEANELWSHVDAARRPALEADMSRAADRLDQDAADLRAELARVTRERDEARAAHARDTKACNAVAVDLAWNTKRKGELEARIADDRDELKSVVKRLKELETEVKETLEAVGKGKQVPLFPTVTIPGATTTVTLKASDRPKLQQAATDLRSKTEQRAAVISTTWPHGGIDYTLESVELPGGQWRSCIHGHEAATEAFERSREEAEANCKAAAVVVFERPAAVDDAVRMPAKRGRKPRAQAGAA